jgi:hypothetical protein
MDVVLDEINIQITKKSLKQMIFLYSALENGWIIKKKKEHYIFSKKHEGKKEILDDNYLTSFIEENTNIENIIKKLGNEN